MKVKLRKILIRMSKLSLYAMIICQSISLALADEATAQRKKLSEIGVHMELPATTSITDLVSSIEEEGVFTFVYAKNRIGKKEVTLHSSYENMMELLNEISNQAKVNIKRVNETIIIKEIDKGLTAVVEDRILEQLSVSGTITDENGDPLPGATVLEKGTTNGTTTDVNGQFKLNCDGEALLTVSFVGYETREIAVNNRSVLDISLDIDSEQLDEVVVVGYGTQKKSDLTGSVVRANLDAFRNQPNTSVIQSLQGTVPGLNVGAVTRPGENPDISIRGRNSLSGSTDPLIVLDGIIYRGSLVELNQNDIESIDILKDASSKAIYGSQAANGVLIITSKKGSKNRKPVFNFSTYRAIQTPSNILEPQNRDEYLQKIHNYYYEEAFLGPDYTSPDPSFDITQVFVDSRAEEGYNDGTDTDWLDLATQNGLVYNADISLAGSTDNVNYYLSAGYTKQEGYAKNDKFDKVNLRANFENAVTSWLTIGMQTFLTSGDYSGQAANFNNALRLSPLNKPYDENGKIIDFPMDVSITNPLLPLEIDDVDKRLNLYGKFFGIIDIPFVEGLSYRLNYSTNYRTRRNFGFNPTANNFAGSAYKDHEMTRDQTIDNLITYKRIFAQKHGVDVTLLYGREDRQGEDTDASVDNFQNQVLGYNALEVGDVTTRDLSSGAWEEFALYQMGRLNYRYDGKYLATFTVRRDGFSGFGADKKFGIFPSAALAWVASRESFVAQALPWVDNLKIRGSYGASGNRTVGRYSTLARTNSNYNYVFGGESVIVTNISSLANDELGWETTTGINLGIDFAVLNNRVSATIDYYDSKTTDILFDVKIPRITGQDDIASNIGEVANKGLEVSLSTVNVSTADFKWESKIVFSKNNNKIVTILGYDDDGDGEEDDLISGNNSLFIGEPIGTIYNYNVQGIYQLDDDIPDGLRPGQFIIEDLDGDGIISPENDRKILGTSNPNYRISLFNQVTYKSLSLSFFFNSIQGGKNDYLSGENPENNSWFRGTNFTNVNIPRAYDYWHPGNPGATYTVPRYRDPIHPPVYRSRSFIRLQDVNLTYAFPKSMLKDVLQGASIFFSAKNLLTITDWKGSDPESGEGIADLGSSPVMKSYSLGFNIKF